MVVERTKGNIPFRLDWAQVYTSDFGPWILTREQVGRISISAA